MKYILKKIDILEIIEQRFKNRNCMKTNLKFVFGITFPSPNFNQHKTIIMIFVEVENYISIHAKLFGWGIVGIIHKPSFLQNTETAKDKAIFFSCQLVQISPIRLCRRAKMIKGGKSNCNQVDTNVYNFFNSNQITSLYRSQYHENYKSKVQ